MGLHGEERPVIILRNVCELCGHSFDNQYGFYKHLKDHYEPQEYAGSYQGHEAIPEEGDANNDGFVNDNEQFEEIFANNINKSPVMIEHLEDFIKNQSRAETIEGMMMIEERTIEAPEFVSIDAQMRNVQESQMSHHHQQQHAHHQPHPIHPQPMYHHQHTELVEQQPQQQQQQNHQNHESQQALHQNNSHSHPESQSAHPEHGLRMVSLSGGVPVIVIEDDEMSQGGAEEHFAEISSLPSCSPPPMAAEIDSGQPENNNLLDETHQTIEKPVEAEAAVAATQSPPPPPSLLPEPETFVASDFPPPTTIQFIPSCDKIPEKSPPELADNDPRPVKKKRSYPCDKCDRFFVSATALKYHKTSHEERKVQCEYCDKMFLTKSTLTIHMRIHTQKRPYHCPHDECTQSFRQKTDLNYHISSRHTAIQDYRFQCDICEKKFARKYSLHLHAKLHTGEKNFKCDVCSKTFRASSYLQTHLRSHTGERPYECEICKRGFAIKADCRRHMQQLHHEGKEGKEREKK